MISSGFTWFPISGLGEPNIYHDLGVFYKNVGILLGDCLTREELSGGYLQEEVRLVLVDIDINF